MKKELLLLILILNSGATFSQIEEIGLKGGLSISNFNSSFYEFLKYDITVRGLSIPATSVTINTQLNTYITGGLFIRCRIKKYISTQIEFLSLTKGFQKSFVIQRSSNEYLSVNENYNFSYISIPVRLQTTITDGRLKWVLYAGPQFSFCIDDEYNYSVFELKTENADFNTYLIERGFQTESHTKKINSTSIILDALAGTELSYNITNKLSVKLDFNYQYGLSSIKKFHSEATQHSYTLKHRSSSVTLGVGMKL